MRQKIKKIFFLLIVAPPLVSAPWKIPQKIYHQEHQEYEREWSASSSRERETKFFIEEKNDETSWLEEEHSFWKERQDWLVEIEREFHLEPSLANREVILKKVAALVEDAEEAEKDLREAASEELKLKVEVEAKSSFAQTIGAIQETVCLGKLFLSSYNDLNKPFRHEQFADSKGVNTSEFANAVANSGTDPFAVKQAIPFASHESEMTVTSSNQPLKKCNGLTSFLINCRTDPYFLRRAGKALVGLLAGSSLPRVWGGVESNFVTYHKINNAPIYPQSMIADNNGSYYLGGYLLRNTTSDHQNNLFGSINLQGERKWFAEYQQTSNSKTGILSTTIMDGFLYGGGFLYLSPYYYHYLLLPLYYKKQP